MKTMKTKVFFNPKSSEMSYLFLIHLNTYVMDLQPL